MALINKMDRTGADFFRTVEMMTDRLGTTAVPIQLPIGSAEQFKGVVDLIEYKGFAWDDANLGTTVHEIDIPEEMMGMVAEYRSSLIETIVEWG